VSMVVDRTQDQCRTALDTANYIRCWRSRLKRKLHDLGRHDACHHVARLLVLIPPELDTMKVRTLLLAIPSWGDGKVNMRMNAARLSPSKTIWGLSERQRAELRDVLLRDAARAEAEGAKAA
jgi:hypothetical protein